MILQADARSIPLRDESVHCVVTSPPYWGLRDYGIEPQVWGGDPDCRHEWKDHRWYTEQSAARGNGSAEAFSEAGPENAARLKEARWRQDSTCSICSAWRGVLGLEPTPELYVEHLVEIFTEVWRVLRKDGTVWLNLGDSYANDGKWGGETGGIQAYLDDNNRKRVGREKRLTGLKPKDLCGMPWRVAFALQAAGWWLRSYIIWSKPNPMPESVTDRPTRSHEYIFLLEKSERYYFDQAAVKEPCVTGNARKTYAPGQVDARGNGHDRGGGTIRKTLTRGKWSEEASQSSGHRIVEAVARARAEGNNHDNPFGLTRNIRSVWTIATQPFPEAHFATFPEDLIKPCILAGAPAGGIVLDPFVGSGTTVKVAQDLGRRGVGLDLKREYLAMALRRSAQGGLVFAPPIDEESGLNAALDATDGEVEDMGPIGPMRPVESE